MGRLSVIAAILSLLLGLASTASAQSSILCNTPWSPCYGKRLTCPAQCPHVAPAKPFAKACFLDCFSPKCEAFCQFRGPNCNGHGSGCYDPRFIGGDGAVFYFHGRKGEHFALISDPELQVNARFMGLRPPGRPRDYTWIQAIGIMHGQHTLTVSATPATHWDDAQDHLTVAFDGQDLEVPEGHRSQWKEDGVFVVERTGSRNGMIISIAGIGDVSIGAVPVTEEDDRVHNYQIPKDDCFVHLEVQFRLHRVSEDVEGVLGRTYRGDYESSGKMGVGMAVVGGEERYKTTSLLSADCKACVFDFGARPEHESMSAR